MLVSELVVLKGLLVLGRNDFLVIILGLVGFM